MTDDTTNNEVVADATQAEDSNIQISVEQICAAILATIGSVEVALESLVKNYGGKTISVNQNPETKAVTFALADIPEDKEAILETETSPAE